MIFEEKNHRIGLQKRHKIVKTEAKKILRKTI